MLSVIIPLYNQTAEVANVAIGVIQQVAAVARVPTHVITVDNVSKYKLNGVADFELFRESNNIAEAFNQGAHLIPKDNYLCFLNSDCRVEAGWDEALIQCADAGLHVAFPWTNGVKNEGVGVAGWCFLVSRGTFAKVGDFDPSFGPAYYEDTDWFHRALNAQATLYSVPAAKVVHTRGTSTRAAEWIDRRDWLFLSNRLRYSWKHSVDPNDAPPFWKAPLPDWKG